MRVDPFADQYDLAADLYGVSVSELRRRDAMQEPLGRWLVTSEGAAIGVVAAKQRPDDRVFLTFGCRRPNAYGALTESVASSLGRALHTSISTDAVEAWMP